MGINDAKRKGEDSHEDGIKDDTMDMMEVKEEELEEDDLMCEEIKRPFRTLFPDDSEMGENSERGKIARWKWTGLAHWNAGSPTGKKTSIRTGCTNPPLLSTRREQADITTTTNDASTYASDTILQNLLII